MQSAVEEFADKIDLRRTRGLPLKETPNGKIHLNLCRRCILGVGIPGATLWDHPSVSITNIADIDETADRLGSLSAGTMQ